MASCDTFVARGESTTDGYTIFAKNSDRELNESQALVFFPRKTYPEGSTVKCTYSEIPQVKKTFAVFLCKPFWMWGAEMGVNEHGVCIGNEAIFTSKRKSFVTREKNVLLGMDVLRLGLERASTAREAVDVITSLHSQFDQGGNAHHWHKFYYHNAYLIADRKESWIVETSGRDWVAKRVTDSIGSISNISKIQDTWDLSSESIQKESKSVKVRFADTSNDAFVTYFANGNGRQCRTFSLLEENSGKLDISVIKSIMRDHASCNGAKANSDRVFDPTQSWTELNVCMHFGFGPIRGTRTSNSFIVRLSDDDIEIWITGTGAPCTSIFKPIWFSSLLKEDINISEISGEPSGNYDSKSLWWKHELLYRRTVLNFDKRLKLFSKERDSIEAQFRKEVIEFRNSSSTKKANFTRACFETHYKKIDEWLSLIEEINPKRLPIFYSYALGKENSIASMGNLVNFRLEFTYAIFFIVSAVALVTVFR